MMEPRYHPGLAKAIEAAGGMAALAKALGISLQAVSGWQRVPPHRAHAVAAFTGIPLHELRPDLWKKPA